MVAVLTRHVEEEKLCFNPLYEIPLLMIQR